MFGLRPAGYEPQDGFTVLMYDGPIGGKYMAEDDWDVFQRLGLSPMSSLHRHGGNGNSAASEIQHANLGL